MTSDNIFPKYLCLYHLQVYLSISISIYIIYHLYLYLSISNLSPSTFAPTNVNEKISVEIILDLAWKLLYASQYQLILRINREKILPIF